ncbi:MAG: aminoacyl-tRNA hydrolase [Nitrospiraceae bacterium]
MWILVGLGNPGSRYAMTRHNVGALTLKRAASSWSIPVRQAGARMFGEGSIGSNRVLLAGPLGWMNESGPPLRALLNDHQVSPDRLIVIHDDLDLEFGRLRLRRSGGSGGHNGLKSILESLGTPDFCRIKIGIGRPAPGQDSADYVLEPFSDEEAERLPDLLERAVRSVECVVTEGIEVAMNRFNPLASEA